ncbi:hypothetical protein GOV13_02155 [Candidatus Pacearchaeota archaeon]|nr:hypothetical protein [Candidatus Pacearchaeota archaeon]
MTKSLEDIQSIEHKLSKRIKKLVELLEKTFDKNMNEGDFKETPDGYLVEKFWGCSAGPLYTHEDEKGLFYDAFCYIPKGDAERTFRTLERKYLESGWKNAKIYKQTKGDSWIFLMLKLTPDLNRSQIKSVEK